MLSASSLNVNQLLAAFPAAELQRWVSQLEPVQLAMGEVLYESGHVPSHAYFPTTAVVSLLSISEDGDCDEIAVVGREGVVGVSLFMGSQSTTGRAIVQAQGGAYRVRGQVLQQEFERSPAIMHLLLRYTMALGAQISQTVLFGRKHALAQRLSRRLMQALDRQQGNEILMTQEQLAGMLGVRRESITAEAYKLQKAGVIQYSRGHIFVPDRAALAENSCECYAAVQREYERLAPGTGQDAESIDYTLAPDLDHELGGIASQLRESHAQERGDLAREIHDELGALLTCAKLDVAGLRWHLGTTTSPEIEQRLEHLDDLIGSCVTFSHRVAKDLHPSLISSLGLTTSLEVLAREFADNCGVEMQTNLEEADIDATAQLTMYWVVQETLNNAGKYAQASQARIMLIDCGTDVLMTVRDNGRGFDPARVKTSSRGLAGMRHWVEACRGQFTVQSASGQGTVVTIVLPKMVRTRIFPRGSAPGAARPAVATRAVPGIAWHKP